MVFFPNSEAGGGIRFCGAERQKGQENDALRANSDPAKKGGVT
jgi:hypothetical protein